MFIFNVLLTFLVLTTVVESEALEDDGQTSDISSNSAPDDFPFLVGVISNKFNEDQIVCTGTLISSHFILSSAYCTLQLKPKIQLYHRSSSTALDYRWAASEYYHPAYNSELRLNDLCLIKLVEPFRNVDDFVLLSSKIFTHNKTQLDCVVAGIGNPEGLGYQMPVRAKYGRNACRIAKSNPSLKYIINYTWPEFLCAKPIGKTAASRQPCHQGDPLLCHGNKQYGTFSYGYHANTTSRAVSGTETSECRDPGVQSRFLFVNKHTDWIANTVLKHAGDEPVDGGRDYDRPDGPADGTPRDPSAPPPLPPWRTNSSSTEANDVESFEPSDSYSYLVYLTGGPGEPVCGGTLISPTHVLTSAYCTSRMSEIEVIVALKEEKHSKASLVYVHPNFESDTLVADISIVVLREPLDVVEYARFSNAYVPPDSKRTMDQDCVVLSKRPRTRFHFEPVNIKLGPKACQNPSDSDIQTVVNQTWSEFSCGVPENPFYGETGDPVVCDGILCGITSHSYETQPRRHRAGAEQMRYLVIDKYGKWINDVVNPVRSGAQRVRVPGTLAIVGVSLLRIVQWIALNQTNDFKIKPDGKTSPPGYRCEWNTRKTFNRNIESGTNKNLCKWGYNTETVECDCGSEQTEQHNTLVCPLNLVSRTPEDLAEANDAAIQVANQWSRKGV